MLTPADLFEVRKIVASAQLLTRGDFDKELERMEEAAQRSVGEASQEASRIRAQADQYLDTIQTKSRALLEEVNAAKEELAAEREKLEADRAAADQQQGENQEHLRDQQQALAAERAAHEAQAAELAPRLAEVARKESNLDVQLARTAELQAELSDKLARLRAVAA